MITKKHKISEILEAVPDSVIYLKSAGIKLGCDGNSLGTLESELAKLNRDEKSMSALLERINKLKEEKDAEVLVVPQESDFKAEEVIEGNKRYYRLGGMLFSQSALDNLLVLGEGKGLRIAVSLGGCSGFKYFYDFFDQPSDDEKVYQLHEKLRVFMSDFTFAKLYGSVVDFSIGLHGSGLKIINPNVKRSCSCGTSVGF